MERRKEDNADETPPAEAVDDEADASEEPSFFARYFKVILAVLVLAGVGGGVGVAYTQYGHVAQAAAFLPFVGGEDGEEAAEPVERGTFTEMKGLVVNPAESSGARYLAAGLAFETTSPEVAQELEENRIVVRDAVLDVLASRTVEELSATDRRDALKDTLRAATNDLLQSGAVDRLYFTQFVLQ